MSRYAETKVVTGNAYFPFISAEGAGQTFTPTVYRAEYGTDPDPTISLTGASGVIDLENGVYALQVDSGDMATGNNYYAVCKSASETITIPMWTMQAEDVNTLGAEIGDFSDLTNLQSLLAVLGSSALDDAGSGVGTILLDIVSDSDYGLMVAADNRGTPGRVVSEEVDTGENCDGVETEFSFTITVDEESIRPGSVEVYSSGDSDDKAYDNGSGGFSAPDSGTIDYSTGAVSVTFGTAPVAGDLTVDYIELDVLGDLESEDLGTGQRRIYSAIDEQLAGNIEDEFEGVHGSPDNLATALLAIANYADILDDGTNGLANLKSLIDTVDTVVDGIQTDLSNGTDGLGAIKTAVDANQTDIELVKTEIGDVSEETELGGDGATDVAGALELIYGVIGGGGDLADQVWDEALSGHTTAGTAGQTLQNIETMLEHGTYGLSALDTDLGNIETDTQDIQSKIGSPAGASVSADVAAVKSTADAIETDTQDLQSKVGSTFANSQSDAGSGQQAMYSRMGAPAGASMSADVAAIKSVVDTLDAKMAGAAVVPMVPATLMSPAIGQSDLAIEFSALARDLATGVQESLDTLGTSPTGEMYVECRDSAGTDKGSLLYTASNLETNLSASDNENSAPATTYRVMNDDASITGYYNAYFKVVAGDSGMYIFKFYGQDTIDGTPSIIVATAQLMVEAYHRVNMGHAF